MNRSFLRLAGSMRATRAFNMEQHTQTITQLDQFARDYPRLSFFFSFSRLHIERAPYCEAAEVLRLEAIK